MNDMDKLRQEYAENELDHDRNPTEDGFVEWLAGQVVALRAERRHAEEHLEEVSGWTLDPAGARIVTEWRAALGGSR